MGGAGATVAGRAPDEITESHLLTAHTHLGPLTWALSPGPPHLGPITWAHSPGPTHLGECGEPRTAAIAAVQELRKARYFQGLETVRLLANNG